MTDWAMVVLTAIYVLATILICYYNYGATKASRDQAAEMRRQYEEDNRPYITVELIYERKAFYGLRFSNHGKRLANHVRIQLDQTFLDSLKEPSFSEMLKRANGKECIIGIGQHYDLYFGSNKFRENTDKYPLSGQVVYQDGERTYKEAFNIDFDSYATFFSVNCDFDDFLKETSVYKGYKQDKIEMRGDRAEMSDFPLYLNMVAGGLDCRDQAIGGFSFVVKIYAVPVVEIIG